MKKKKRGFKSPTTIKLLKEARERYERGEGPHPLASWAQNWNNQLDGIGSYERFKGWQCVCAGQGGEIYSAQCPIHDPHVDTTDVVWRKWYDDHLEAQRKIKERLGWT